MAKFYAATSKGLRDVLQKEIQDLGLKVLKAEGSGVHFESSWKGCYMANYCLRSATRVLKPILDFPAYNGEDLYYNVKKHDFTKYIDPHQTLAIHAQVNGSALKDQRFVALKIKDAVVDQFREKRGRRPDVNTKSPDLSLRVRVAKNQVNVSLDTSSRSLSQRGYRTDAGVAPLREHLAAGLILLTDWDQQSPFVDLMCGSGTFLLEAALMQNQLFPGDLKTDFGFQKWKIFQHEAYQEMLNDLEDAKKAAKPALIQGLDKDPDMMAVARKNLKRLPIADRVQLQRKDFRNLNQPLAPEAGIVLVNPPYGERLDDIESLKPLYHNLGVTLRKHFKGWTAWVFSPHPELTSQLRMKSEKGHTVFNGAIECKLMKYPVGHSSGS